MARRLHTLVIIVAIIIVVVTTTTTTTTTTTIVVVTRRYSSLLVVSPRREDVIQAFLAIEHENSQQWQTHRELEGECAAELQKLRLLQTDLSLAQARNGVVRGAGGRCVWRGRA